jgi:hypothetical protein
MKGSTCRAWQVCNTMRGKLQFSHASNYSLFFTPNSTSSSQLAAHLSRVAQLSQRQTQFLLQTQFSLPQPLNNFQMLKGNKLSAMVIDLTVNSNLNCHYFGCGSFIIPVRCNMYYQLSGTSQVRCTGV